MIGVTITDAADGGDHLGIIFEEVSAVWLRIEQDALGPELSIEPFGRDAIRSLIAPTPSRSGPCRQRDRGLLFSPA